MRRLRATAAGQLPGVVARTSAEALAGGAVVAVTTALGLVLLVSPWLSDEPRSPTATTGLVLLGTAVLAVAVSSWLTRLAPPDAAARVSLVREPAGPAVEVRLRPHQPLGVLVLATGWSVLLAWAVVAAGRAGLLLVPVLLFFLALVPDSARALLRRPVLRYDAAGLRLRGWQTDAVVAWDDVVSVDVAVPDPRRQQLRVEARAGAPSWRSSRSRLLLPLEPSTTGSVLDVPLAALDEPFRLLSHLDAVRRSAPDERPRWFDAAAVDFLTGRLERPAGPAGDDR